MVGLSHSAPNSWWTLNESSASQISSLTPSTSPTWNLGAMWKLLQGPAIAIRITKVDKSPPVLHIDLTNISASFDQFLANGFHVLNHHEQPFERTGLHGSDTHPKHNGAGRTKRCQLDKAQVLINLLVKVSVKAEFLRIKSLCAVNVCDGYCDKFEFHLHVCHRYFPLSLYSTVLLLKVYPKMRTELILLIERHAKSLTIIQNKDCMQAR